MTSTSTSLIPAAGRTLNGKVVRQTSFQSPLREGREEWPDVADKNPEKVAELKQRIEALARDSAQPWFVLAALGATKHVLFGSVATPDEETNLEMQP